MPERYKLSSLDTHIIQAVLSVWAVLPIVGVTIPRWTSPSHPPEPNYDDPATRNVLRSRTQRIDMLYREWSRHRSDADALRELRDAISEYLEESLAAH